MTTIGFFATAVMFAAVLVVSRDLGVAAVAAVPAVAVVVAGAWASMALVRLRGMGRRITWPGDGGAPYGSDGARGASA